MEQHWRCMCRCWPMEHAREVCRWLTQTVCFFSAFYSIVKEVMGTLWVVAEILLKCGSVTSEH